VGEGAKVDTTPAQTTSAARLLRNPPSNFAIRATRRCALRQYPKTIAHFLTFRRDAVIPFGVERVAGYVEGRHLRNRSHPPLFSWVA